jgi:hypothetical protein
MIEIQNKTKIKIQEQLSILRKLAKEGKVEDKSVNWWEPLFCKIDPKQVVADKMIDRELLFRSRNIYENILRYIRVSEGHFNEVELFIDHGISIDVQKDYIRQLLEADQIEEFKTGYRIKQAN